MFHSGLKCTEAQRRQCSIEGLVSHRYVHRRAAAWYDLPSFFSFFFENKRRKEEKTTFVLRLGYTTNNQVVCGLLAVRMQAAASMHLLHTGVQYLLPATWTPLRQSISLARLTELLSTAPAALAGLSDSKGKIAVGYDADLMVSTRGLTQSI